MFSNVSDDSKLHDNHIDVKANLSFFSKDGVYDEIVMVPKEEQKELIDYTLMQETTSNYCFGISEDWYRHWVEYVAEARMDAPPPIDNKSCVSSDSVYDASSLVEVSEEVYLLFSSWYGEGAYIIRRLI